MKYQIRKFNWNNLNQNGIPKDCADVMEFFNQALDLKTYPFVPRLDKITEEELKNVWIPTKDKTITYVAYDLELDKVVGDGALFVGDNIGEYSLTIAVNFQSKGIGTEITKALISDALSKNIAVSLHTSIENIAMQRVMEKLGYKSEGMIKNYGKYIGKVEASGHVYRYLINPPS